VVDARDEEGALHHLPDSLVGEGAPRAAAHGAPEELEEDEERELVVRGGGGLEAAVAGGVCDAVNGLGGARRFHRDEALEKELIHGGERGAGNRAGDLARRNDGEEGRRLRDGVELVEVFRALECGVQSLEAAEERRLELSRWGRERENDAVGEGAVRVRE
jgi:hypothetical protein